MDIYWISFLDIQLDNIWILTGYLKWISFGYPRICLGYHYDIGISIGYILDICMGYPIDINGYTLDTMWISKMDI